MSPFFSICTFLYMGSCFGFRLPNLLWGLLIFYRYCCFPKRNRASVLYHLWLIAWNHTSPNDRYCGAKNVTREPHAKSSPSSFSPCAQWSVQMCVLPGVVGYVIGVLLQRGQCQRGMVLPLFSAEALTLAESPLFKIKSTPKPCAWGARLLNGNTTWHCLF